jgi:hypothetical protein
MGTLCRPWASTSRIKVSNASSSANAIPLDDKIWVSRQSKRGKGVGLKRW